MIFRANFFFCEKVEYFDRLLLSFYSLQSVLRMEVNSLRLWDLSQQRLWFFCLKLAFSQVLYRRCSGLRYMFKLQNFFPPSILLLLLSSLLSWLFLFLSLEPRCSQQFFCGSLFLRDRCGVFLWREIQILLRFINGDSSLVVQNRYFFQLKESRRIGSMAQQSKDQEFMSLLLVWPSFRAFLSSKQQVVVMLLCLLASMQREEQSGSKPQFCSSCRIFLSTVMMLQPTINPALRGTPSANLHQGCSYISAMRYRLAGSTLSTFSIKFLKFLLTKSGKTQSPESIFLYSSAVLLSQKGRQPQTMAKRMTPLDQMSTSRPLYFWLLIISGEAQQGDPQAVFSNSPDLQVLLSPKSTIFRESFQSISKFQGLRSRWTMLSSCRQAIPLMICLKYRQA